jgi:uncharacterized protein YwgA
MSDLIRGYRMKPQAAAVLRLLATGPIRSRKSLQKLVYFLQEGDRTPLGLDYRMYYYGPYSAKLDSSLQVLEALGLVTVSRDVNAVPTYSTSASVAEQVESSPELAGKVKRVVANLGERSPNDLELLSTVHYLAAKQQTGIDRDRLFEQVRAWKGAKFGVNEVTAALNDLRELGYLAH